MPSKPPASPVEASYIDPVGQGPARDRGPVTARRPRGSAREHMFQTPPLPTPQLARPSSWPATTRTRQELLDALVELDPAVTPKEQTRRRVAVGLLLDWLAGFGGQSWQQRWLASGADLAGRDWIDHVTVAGLLPGAGGRAQLTGAVRRLMILGALRPSYHWLYQSPSSPIMDAFRARHDPAGFAALDVICAATERLTVSDRRLAYHQLTRILIHNGGQLAEITLDDCIEAYRAQAGYTSGQRSYWYVLLIQAAILPAQSPPTIHKASRRGQLTVEELVDGYRISCQPIRDLFVDYLHERQPGMDYTSLRQLVSKLVLLFWRDLELHEPGISSLHLSDPVARRWKQRLAEVRHGTNRIGQPRQDRYAILLTVRAFYADLTHWALEDPARWGQWAVPSPITSRDLAGLGKQISRTQSRMHQRTRELTPLLPALIVGAQDQHDQATAVLEACRATTPGECFQAAGRTLRRTALVTDPTTGGVGRPGVLYAHAVDSDGRNIGPRRDLTIAEDNAFWAWAIVDVLRHTGMRIEEMLELTHRSFVAYTLPGTGEVIPLLQITPSKTDRERLLVVSPELADVLSAIITRVRAGNAQLPLVSRYDAAERLHSPPLPLLFQKRWGLAHHALNQFRVKGLLDNVAATAGITAPDGTALRFTPHDFRRIFATEAVASGLPVHIAAKLLGHQTLATTQIYVAIYDQDVIAHHRAFLARRRALRPSEEYREPTDAEWEEFLGHFEKRKVELGICGRAYGTACQHEHACIRCPMLRPDPRQQLRLEQIKSNLHDRLAEAHANGWLGEVDGLEATLTAADLKLAAMRRAGNTPTNVVDLGLPAVAPNRPDSNQK